MLLDKWPIESIESTHRLSETIQDKTELVSLLTPPSTHTRRAQWTPQDLTTQQTFPLEETQELLQTYYHQLSLTPETVDENKPVTIGKWEKCTIKLYDIPCTLFLDEQGSLSFEYDNHHLEFTKALIGKTSFKVAVGSAFSFMLSAEDKKSIDILNRIKKEGLTLKNITTVSVDDRTVAFVYRHIPTDDQGNQKLGEHMDYTISLTLQQLKDLLQKTKQLATHECAGTIEAFVKDYPTIVAYFSSLPETEFPEKFKEFVRKDLGSIKLVISKKPLSHFSNKS